MQDKRLNLTVFFRSHDMVQGWPENAYGMAAIQKEIADGIGADPGILTIISGSAQIYKHYYKQVESMLERFRIRHGDDFNDPRGMFMIKTEEGKITVTHVDAAGRELGKYEGNSSKDVYTRLAFSLSIGTEHALYLGSELGKAETALLNGLDYEQDVPLRKP
jgi:thymidylate synthase